MKSTPLKRRYYLGSHSADIGLAMFVGRSRVTIGEAVESYYIGSHSADCGLAMFVGRSRVTIGEAVESPLTIVHETTGWNLETVVMSPLSNAKVVISTDTNGRCIPPRFKVRMDSKAMFNKRALP